MKNNYFFNAKFLILFLFVLMIANAFIPPAVFAHRVVIFAWMEGDTVFTESQFPDGKKISNAPVNVFDMEKNLLLSGKTDPNGEFSFKVPQISDLNIVLNAGMGHQGHWKISEKEIRAAMGEVSKDMTEEKTSDSPGREPAFPDPKSNASNVSSPLPESNVGLNAEQLETLIEKVMDKKLQPMNRMLAKMQAPGPSVNDIFGGIGYILGLMGVAAYFLSRKKS